MSNQAAPEVVPLALEDLIPQESAFTLSKVLDADKRPIKLTLEPWSVLARKHVLKKYGANGVRRAFESLEIEVVSEVAYYLLDDESKKHFKDEDALLKKIQSVPDQIAIIKAVVQTMGIGEVEIKKLEDAMKPKTPASAETGSTDPNLSAPNP